MILLINFFPSGLECFCEYFNMLGCSDYEETSKFCSMFDRFFDCLNTRNAKEGKQKRKLDLDPYRRVKDKRFEVSVEVN